MEHGLFKKLNGKILNCIKHFKKPMPVLLYAFAPYRYRTVPCATQPAMNSEPAAGYINIINTLSSRL